LKIFLFLFANITPPPPPPPIPPEEEKNGLGLPGVGVPLFLPPIPIPIPIPPMPRFDVFNAGTGVLLPDPAIPPPAGKPSANKLSGGPVRSRTRRMLLGNPGNPPAVGVAGRTLTEWCGDRVDCIGVLDTDVDTEPLDEVELALLCEWWWVWCSERTDETDDEVDLRPRRPGPEERRTVERGVRGDGESEWRL